MSRDIEKSSNGSSMNLNPAATSERGSSTLAARLAFAAGGIALFTYPVYAIVVFYAAIQVQYGLAVGISLVYLALSVLAVILGSMTSKRGGGGGDRGTAGLMVGIISLVLVLLVATAALVSSHTWEEIRQERQDRGRSW